MTDIEITTDIQLDPRTRCPKCRENPLRVPLVFNATDSETGLYCCKGCDTSGTAERLAAVWPAVVEVVEHGLDPVDAGPSILNRLRGLGLEPRS